MRTLPPLFSHVFKEMWAGSITVAALMANRAARVIERLSREADHKEPGGIDPGIVGLERRYGGVLEIADAGR
jgi:hypothetical protein